jgi:hypothetical protein
LDQILPALDTQTNLGLPIEFASLLNESQIVTLKMIMIFYMAMTWSQG